MDIVKTCPNIFFIQPSTLKINNKLLPSPNPVVSYFVDPPLVNLLFNCLIEGHIIRTNLKLIRYVPIMALSL